VLSLYPEWVPSLDPTASRLDPHTEGFSDNSCHPYGGKRDFSNWEVSLPTPLPIPLRTASVVTFMAGSQPSGNRKPDFRQVGNGDLYRCGRRRAFSRAQVLGRRALGGHLSAFQRFSPMKSPGFGLWTPHAAFTLYRASVASSVFCPPSSGFRPLITGQYFPLSTSPVSAHHRATFRHGRHKCTTISR
jgi:hypothetical protein